MSGDLLPAVLLIVLMLAILGAGVWIGIGVLVGRRRSEGASRRPGHGAGMTVAQMLQRTVSLAPVGVVVVDALEKYDFPVIMGTVLFISVILIIINILTDISYAWLDPRVELG